MQDKVFGIKSLKEQFVPAEYSLLKDWARVLELKQKGTVLTYLCIQLGVNRQQEHEHYGKSWLSEKTLADLTGSSRPRIDRQLKVLVDCGFILIEPDNTGRQYFTVLQVPTAKTKEKREKVKALPPAGKDAFSVEAPKGKAIWMKTEIKNWKTPELASYWGSAFSDMVVREKKTKAAYGFPNKKELSLLKKLLNEYDPAACKKAIDYFMENFRTILGDSFPTISALYGFRRTVFPESTVGRAGKNNQWKEEAKKKVPGGAFAW